MREAGWLSTGLCYICEIGHLRVPSTKLRKDGGGVSPCRRRKDIDRYLYLSIEGWGEMEISLILP